MLISFNWLKDFVEIKMGHEALAHKLTMAGLEVESIQDGGNDQLEDSLFPPMPLGSPLAKPDGSPHDRDVVFDINVTPNRGDCLSIKGIAREVSAITEKELKIPPHPPLLKGGRGDLGSAIKIKDYLSVEVKENGKCPRYAARVVDGVKIAPSPDWMIRRLESCGIRAINNVVDATNYVMLETGQPFHAFDYRYIRGKKIVIQTPKNDTEFVTLDGIKRKILKDDLLICDGSGAIALAGVMGGADSEVKPDTTAIVLESACFNPVTIRRTAKRLGLASESSRRFERGIDPNGTVDNLNKLTELIVKLSGGTPTVDRIDIYPKKFKPLKVRLSASDVNKLLGTDIKETEIKKYLKGIGIAYANNVCTVPTGRPDLTRPADLIEEIARLHGYDKIPTTLPSFRMSGLIKPDDNSIVAKAKDILAANGFFEAINYGFCSPSELEVFSEPADVTIANPLGIEFSAMKTTLISGLMNNLKLNFSLGQNAVRLFEMRPVFKDDSGKIIESNRLAGIISGSRNHLSWTYKQEPADFYDIKGACEGLFAGLGLSNIKFNQTDKYKFLHPQAAASIAVGGVELGWCGILHPEVTSKFDIEGEVCAFEIGWDELSRAALARRPHFKQLERFPSVRRDVALLINENTRSEDIAGAIRKFGSGIIKKAAPFDVYKGKGIPAGKKSMAYAITYADPERTLTDGEVNEAHSNLINYLKEKLGAEIR